MLPKVIILVISFAIQGILSMILSVSETKIQLFTPITMLFNQLDLLDINFFNMTSNHSALYSSSSALYIVKENIARWYVGLRNLSTAGLLAVLAYIGIRMAFSTVAEDKSKYKKLLRYWVESFALLFVLHYLMIAVIGFNDAIVEMMYKSMVLPKSIKDISQTLSFLYKAIFMNNISGFAATLVYAMNVGVTAAFFAIYLKRFMMVGFLIVIAPLITITYSIDKVGDGKSQALNQWLKLFMYNVLIQPFHCVLYLIFVSQAVSMVSNLLPTFETEIAGSVLAVASMMFMFKAEEILKQIFGFDKAGKSLMSGLIAGKMIGDTVKIGIKKTTSGVKTIGKFTGLDKKYKNSNVGKFFDSKPGRAVSRAVSSSANVAMASMVAPSSGSVAFGMLTSGGDQKKKEEYKLKDELDDFKKEFSRKLDEFIKDYDDDKKKTEEIVKAYQLDFSKPEVYEIYKEKEEKSPGGGMRYFKFASDLKEVVNKHVELYGGNPYEVLQSEVINSVVDIPEIPET